MAAVYAASKMISLWRYEAKDGADVDNIESSHSLGFGVMLELSWYWVFFCFAHQDIIGGVTEHSSPSKLQIGISSCSLCSSSPMKISENC